MAFAASTIWWSVAGLLVAVELAGGTFYLLMLALGCVAGALAAHAGLGSTVQVVVAAVVGVGATAAWHFKRSRSPRSLPARSNADVNIDIGELVQVDHWHADATARVPYRGACWSARLAGHGMPLPGRHRIVAVDGSQLQLVADVATPNLP